MSATRFLLVLHGHIPDVVGHGVWPHGENWVYEAAAETYLPFLRTVETLWREGTPVKATVGLTPVLAEQLQDPRFVEGFRRYLAQRAKAAAEDVPRLVLGDGVEAPQPLLADVAERWRAWYEGLLADFEARPGHDLVASFRRLADVGVIEPIACAATHGFLPLLPTDRAIERQLDVGIRAHTRHFGRAPKGIWLPECAYRPAGPWVSPSDGRVEVRRGLEDFLAARGIRFFFVETHLVQGGVTHPAYGGAVFREDAGHTPYRIHAVPAIDGTPVGVLARDPLSSQQVWSGKVGYPGDGRYLEFHKKKWPSGHRYWRVTDSRLDLPEKLPYQPEAIPAALAAHATHFVTMLENAGRLPDGEPPIVVGMFDFELFGHWWFEGPEFLREVFRRLRGASTVRAATVSEAMAETPPRTRLTLPPGTWGRGGDFQVWWNAETADYWKRVDAVEKRMEDLEERARDGSIPDELLEALERQILLLQSSDWPFLIDNEVSKDYAAARIQRHAEDFDRLARMAESGEVDRGVLEEIGERDRLFHEELARRG